MTVPILLLQAAGLAHFGILCASALTPHVLDWRGALAPLPSLLRQIFWVYGVFIVLVIVAFGTLTLSVPQALAEGTPLARGFCAFVAIFWLARLAVQFWVFDATPYLSNAWLRLGYHTLTVAFAFLTAVYGAAAVLPAKI